MNAELVVQLCYLAASILFILGLQGLGSPERARRGVLLAEIGMVLAVAGTLLRHEVITYQWIIAGALIGAAVGTWISLKIPMTMMPERIAFSHAFGGLAVALVGISEYWHLREIGEQMNTLQMTATGLEVLLGAVTFTGSLVAFGKLQGFLSGKPVTFKGQNFFNLVLAVVAVALVLWLVFNPTAFAAFCVLACLALVIGVSLVMPIGGADMPVVICLLNSYAGLAAAATGFSLRNNVLIICGALDGGSGFILGMMMSKAMNRSFSNVLFGAFGSATTTTVAGELPGRAPNQASVEDAVEVLRAARTVIVVPGYGMAVSQAQHAVHELQAALAAGGCTVKYAIHPVAGRMPGHMNVLLAEANVAYDALFDLEQINDEFAAADVALVVGANDVVNPAARTDPASPIFGMPILNADAARSCIVLKRSLNPGFAGIENGLFVSPNTMLVLGDAKKTITAFTQAIKSG
ncbi:MAG TPA: NAD(P)(+) transhydrogenase (Re/Si-specific) subunit beta [Myxococcales bacterium]|nr:NAD(P)(+) transhydrogenase (Re/Si-specific) subunit beta [Myxococcales bacterium]